MNTETDISHHWLTLALIAVVTLISGCATGLSKQECETADWRTIGYEDGVQGRQETRIGSHRKACAEHDVAPVLDAYRAGWEEGVTRYCQPGNGYHQGRTGKEYAGVCPQWLEAAFLEAYRDGRSHYQLQLTISRLSKKLTKQRNRLQQVDLDIRDAGLELVARGVPTERRVVLLDEIRKLTEERSDLKTRIPQLEAELEQQKQHMAATSSASALQ